MNELEKSTVNKDSNDEQSNRGIRYYWERIPREARVLMSIILVLTAAGGTTLLVSDRTDYKVLFSSLEPDDANKIVSYLKTKNVPYKLSEVGESISVPSSQVHELRLELAGEGLPTGSGVGFEIFDEQRFGMTEFEEQVTLRRALEGELARTIVRLDSVKSARVHIVLPKRSIISSQSTKAQASVVLELIRGKGLSEETAGAIIHLVSSSVEGLTPESITVVDTRGRILSAENSMGNKTRGLEYKAKYEADLEIRLREMLDTILGPSSSVVRVAAQFDLSEMESTEEQYDPEGSVVRSEQREVESSGGNNSGGRGIPGARTNLPGGATPENVGGASGTRREMETKNYEVDKVVKRIVTPAGRLSQVSVSILVDGVDNGKGVFQPRPDAELEKIDAAVKAAVGYDKNRGDQVTVQSIPFHIPESVEMPEGESGPAWWKEYIPLAAGLLVALLVVIVILSMRKKRPTETLPVQSLSLPKKVHELEAIVNKKPEAMNEYQDSLLSSSMPVAGLIGQVQRMFMDDSERASRVLKSWLNEESRSDGGK